MSSIIPDVDAYGTYVRESALADILELQAINKPLSISKAQLTDFIFDSGWNRLLGDPILSPDDDEPKGHAEEFDESDESAQRVFDLILERIDLLGPKYPFQLNGERLEFVNDITNSYLLLLSITISHAYEVHVPGVIPHNIFEDLVEACFKHKGFLAANLARIRRDSSNFKEAVRKLGPILCISPTPELGTARRRAHDEGVDIIGHLSWDDDRQIHWIFLVQATCGKSNCWRTKLAQPSPNMWKNLLGLRVSPIAMLAVPHHIPSGMIALLTEDKPERFLLDRIRLCISGAADIGGSSDMLEHLKSLDVEIE